MYKTSFNGLSISVKGVYSAYNLTREEFESLTLAFDTNSINGSSGNYTIFQNAQRKVLLKLFVHELWIPIVFDIRDDLLRLYNSGRIYEDKIVDLSKRLKKMRIQLHVVYNEEMKEWEIVDYKGFLEILKILISEQKEGTG